MLQPLARTLQEDASADNQESPSANARLHTIGVVAPTVQNRIPSRVYRFSMKTSGQTHVIALLKVGGVELAHATTRTLQLEHVAAEGVR